MDGAAAEFGVGEALREVLVGAPCRIAEAAPELQPEQQQIVGDGGSNLLGVQPSAGPYRGPHVVTISCCACSNVMRPAQTSRCSRSSSRSLIAASDQFWSHRLVGDVG